MSMEAGEFDPNYDEVPSSDKLMEIGAYKQEYDPQIAKILVDNLKSDIPEELKEKLFGFANSRVFLSKIDADQRDKQIIWEQVNIAELDYIMSIPTEQYTSELDSILAQLKFEVMLGLNLSDEGLGFKGFSESFRFQEFSKGAVEGGEKKKAPSFFNPKRWIR